ncbi:MAG: TaqI-like C-terminal specificity domain-containing protein [Cytophagales bacterium]|nr:TaqI-like C-terminal specificity domain-containing protein [Cytophagales bacterium]
MENGKEERLGRISGTKYKTTLLITLNLRILKFVWGELADEPKFAIDENGLYPNNTLFFMTGSGLKYICGILNSKLSKWYFNQISTSSRDQNKIVVENTRLNNCR